MPNMMFFGYDEERVSKLGPLIAQVMRELGVGQSAVITVVPSRVECCDSQGSPGPYLRLCHTKPKEDEITSDEIVHALRQIGVDEDIEVVELAAFHPKVEREEVELGGDGHKV